MYIRKDIHKSLRLEAKMAEGAKCFAWAKLFRECDWLLRKKDREIERLRAALREIIRLDDEWVPETQDDYSYGGYIACANKARAALERK